MCGQMNDEKTTKKKKERWQLSVMKLEKNLKIKQRTTKHYVMKFSYFLKIETKNLLLQPSK